mgnify:CR=1 FL=1
MRTKLSIICLNCFGSPLSFNWRVRLKLLADQLNTLNPDIICLQEIFTRGQREILLGILAKSYNRYSSEVVNMSRGGLITFVKKDIKLDEYHFKKYKNQGSIFTLAITDRMAGKGIQNLNLSFSDKALTIVNTHLLCLYGGNKTDINDHKKQTQQLISYLIEYKSNLVLCGDINIFPTDSILSEIKTTLNVRENLPSNSITVSPDNLNRGTILNHFGDGKPYRTDYTLVSKLLGIVKQEIILNDPVKYNGKDYNLSDHYGVYTEIEFQK